MQKYTVAFIFNRSLKKVLLVSKLNPSWQRGFLNGIGGKVEEGESSLECIKRETKEESNLDISLKDWTYIGNLSGSDWFLDVFTSVYKGQLNDAEKMDKEKIGWYKVNNLPKNIIDNLNWLIPLSIYQVKTQNLKEIKVIMG